MCDKNNHANVCEKWQLSAETSDHFVQPQAAKMFALCGSWACQEEPAELVCAFEISPFGGLSGMSKERRKNEDTLLKTPTPWNHTGEDGKYWKRLEFPLYS